jgi:hypothetical protein
MKPLIAIENMTDGELVARINDLNEGQPLYVLRGEELVNVLRELEQDRKIILAQIDLPDLVEQITRNLYLDWEDALRVAVMDAVHDCGGDVSCDTCPDFKHCEHPGRGLKN